jgi:hypothetical protein
MTGPAPFERADGDEDGSGSLTRSHSLFRFAAFFAGVAGLAALVLVVAPALPRLLGIETQAQFIKDSGIRAGAWFYTEVDEIPMIESVVRSAMKDKGRARGDAIADVK